MLVASGGGGGPLSSPPPPPPAPPKPPPVLACTLQGDSVTQSAPSQHSSFLGSLWHSASSGAESGLHAVSGGVATGWHVASSGAASAWHAAAPIVSPAEQVAKGAYDTFLKPDIDGVLQHQQAAKDILTMLMPGTGQVTNTAIGAVQDYFGSKSPTHGSILGSLRASSSVNNPISAAERLASHPETTLATGFHLAMLGSWFIPGAGEAVDGVAHVGIGVARDVGAGAARDVIEHAGSKIVEASRLGEAELAKTIEPGGRVFWTGGEQAAGAAKAFAEKHGLQTLEMSDLGKTAEHAAAVLSEKLNAQGLEPWTNGVRDIWAHASTEWAQGAEGFAHAFLRETARLPESMWVHYERPVLETSEKIAQIVKHDVF